MYGVPMKVVVITPYVTIMNESGDSIEGAINNCICVADDDEPLRSINKDEILH